MTIDEVISICLTAIFKEDIFNETLYLKGGQALRIKENLKSRFSADIDFSTKEKISDGDLFFNNLKESLYAEFSSHSIHLFDFNPVRRPDTRKEGVPDFWGGWGVTFKLIQAQKMTLDLAKMRREAIIPAEASSTNIKLDISEYEYCGSVELVKVNSVSVNVYSRTLLLLEKMRAICQQHSSYELTGTDSRARDYFDIEQLWNKVIQDSNEEPFLEECRKHIKNVFSAKDVDLVLLEKIFDKDFLEIQKTGWPSVRSTVSGIKVEEFEYYNEVLRQIIKKINL